MTKLTAQERQELVAELLDLKTKLRSIMPRPLQPWEAEMARTVSNADMHQIWREQRAGVTERSSLARIPQSEPRPASGGTVEVKPPPGIDIIDRMCAEQDRADRAAALRVRIETELVEELMRQRMGHDDDE